MTNPRIVLTAEALSCTYRIPTAFHGTKTVEAVKSVDLAVHEGEVIAIVGESGSGKSTLGRLFVRLQKPTGGRVMFDGADIGKLHGSALVDYRGAAQIIFQNPYASLNPRMRIRDTLGEVLRVWRRRRPSFGERKVDDLLDMVHLPQRLAAKYPHELSGGQRQRVAIARAMAVNPRFLVADEPVSSLDVAAAANVLNLLLEFRQRTDLTCVFITHDLGLARKIADRVVVMHLGEVVDAGTPTTIFEHPGDAYTKSLIRAQLPLPTVPVD
jgi:peptide/nickel transport system ATP-binding protein